MTTPSSQQQSHEPGRYNPVTFDQVLRSTGSALTQPVSSFFSGPLAQPVPTPTGPVSFCLAAPLFAFAFFEAKDLRLFSPLLILVLLGCVLSRMEGPVRRIAAVPLALSTVKLSVAMSACLTADRVRTPQNMGFDPGFVWLPIFFSVCLAFIRDKETNTFKVIFFSSCALLGAGLLPSQAFIAIFYMVDVLLFFGIVIAIFADVLPYLQKPANGATAAH
jgi:hypothetical protein